MSKCMESWLQDAMEQQKRVDDLARALCEADGKIPGAYDWRAYREHHGAIPQQFEAYRAMARAAIEHLKPKDTP